MHACGHDFRKPSLLGQQLFSRKKTSLKEPYAWSFNQQKKSPRGCFWCFATGLLEDVQGIIGFHNIPQLKQRQQEYDGRLKFKVTVTGVCCRPDLGSCYCNVSQPWFQNTINVPLTVSPLQTAVLSITHLDLGSAWNVLPKSGYFEGTIRSFNPSVQKRVEKELHFYRSSHSEALKWMWLLSGEWPRPLPLMMRN